MEMFAGPVPLVCLLYGVAVILVMLITISADAEAILPILTLNQIAELVRLLGLIYTAVTPAFASSVRFQAECLAPVGSIPALPEGPLEELWRRT